MYVRHLFFFFLAYYFYIFRHITIFLSIFKIEHNVLNKIVYFTKNKWICGKVVAIKCMKSNKVDYVNFDLVSNPGGGGTSIETLYGNVPPKWVGF